MLAEIFSPVKNFTLVTAYNSLNFNLCSVLYTTFIYSGFPRSYSIKAGTSRLSSTGTIVKVKSIIIHDDYYSESGDYDIALVEVTPYIIKKSLYFKLIKQIICTFISVGGTT